ncbi:hypothetical protein [Sphingomicrobium marinum]|uniref:hypothetical protein n=1 Tax=Sphingomicrobium marinum TaxID=1227950 RepID=UPI00223FDA7A|nr:hypothetical protein [Sphingomicrobium marinum]
MILAALSLMLIQPATETRVIFPQTSLGEPITPEQAPDTCVDALARPDRASAIDLLRGSASCSYVEREAEGSFLLNIGLIRALVDFEALLPKDAAASARQNELMIVLYYNAASVGSDDVLRDAGQRSELVERLESWEPYFAADYDPGWEVGEAAASEQYLRMIDEIRDLKLEEIDRVTILVNDPEYWALHQERNQVLDRLMAAETQDPADHERLSEIQRMKFDRAAELGDPQAVAALAEPRSDSISLEPPRRAGPDPSVPEGAVIVSNSDNTTIERCRRQAKRDALSSDGKLVGEVITDEPGIGLVYRADVEDGPKSSFPGVTRHFCSERFTGSTPRESDMKPLAPWRHTPGQAD